MNIDEILQEVEEMMDAGRFDAIEQLLGYAEELEKDNPNVEAAFAKFYFLSDEFELAADRGLRSLSLGNTGLETYVIVGGSLDKMYDFRKSAKVWHQAVQNHPINDFFHRSLGYAHLMNHDIPLAKKHLRMAVHSDSLDSLPYIYLSSIYFDEDDFEKALSVVDTGIHNGAVSDYRIYLHKISGHIFLGQYDDAETTLDNTIEIISENQLPILFRAQIFHGRGIQKDSNPEDLVAAEHLYLRFLENHKKSDERIVGHPYYHFSEHENNAQMDRVFYAEAASAENGLNLLQPAFDCSLTNEALVHGILSQNEVNRIKMGKPLPFHSEILTHNPSFLGPSSGHNRYKQ